MSEEIDHDFTDEITCPHCGEELGDSWEYPDSGDNTCYECKGKFTHERDITVTYSTEPLNENQMSEKTYTTEQVKTIVANAVQNVTNKLYAQRECEDQSARNYAINYVDKSKDSDKYSALKHMYGDEVLERVISNIKDQQYHMFVDKLLQTNKI